MLVPVPFRPSRPQTWVLPCSLLVALCTLSLPYGFAWARTHKRGTFFVPSRAEALKGAEAFTATQATVVVQTGDTLWALCRRYTGKAWIWPQVWAMNPQLTNPHWLEPGSVLHFVAAGKDKDAGAGKGVQVANAMDAGAGESAAATPPGTHPTGNGSAVAAPPSQQPPNSRAQAAAAQRPTLRSALWPEAAVHALPRLVAALGDAGLARRGDRLAVVAPPGAPLEQGELYVALALEGSVDGLEDPHSPNGKEGGKLLSVAGVLRALGSGRKAEVVLEHPLAEVQAGQYLAPLAAFRPEAGQSLFAPDKFLAQVLVVEDGALVVGGQKLAFLGAGSQAGLAPGMRLWLVPGKPTDAPFAPTGELRVLQVHPHHSTCAVVHSARELGRGQYVRGGQNPQAANDPSH